MSDVVSNLQVTADNSAWFQKGLASLPVYKKVSEQSLSLQLIASGLVKSKPMSRQAFVAALQSIHKNSSFILYKPQPGIISLGQIKLASGMMVDTSYSFNDAGEFVKTVLPAVSAGIKDIKGEISITVGGVSRYTIKIERDGKPVTKDVRSTDSIVIEGVDRQYESQLSVNAEECSA